MKFKAGLSAKAFMGYALVLILVMVASLLCYSTIDKNHRSDNRLQASYLPWYRLLKDLQVLHIRATGLAGSLTDQPDDEEMQQLRGLYQVEFPALKRQYDQLPADPEAGIEEIRAVFERTAYLLSTQMELLSYMPYDSTGRDKAKASALFKQTITPEMKSLSAKLESAIRTIQLKIEQEQQDKVQSYSFLLMLFIAATLLLVIILVVAYNDFRTNFQKTIVSLNDIILDMSHGKDVKVRFEERADEIGEMTRAIGSLMAGIHARSDFASQIGKGNYENEFTLFSSDDVMGKALLEMRDNLKRNAEEEQKRNWIVSGLAMFGSIIRDQTDFQKLGDSIISNVVRYTNSNQGYLFVINDENKDDVHLRLLSCYAWDKKKYLEKAVREGHGLAGQCWLEGAPVFITEVPPDYVHITSGLGQATPRCIFIVPLKIHDTVYGVLELASFQPYREYEREFIVKVCETIASAIATVKVTEQTKYLLEQSQQQAEEMRSQEEEMRQNLEELQAIQEGLERMMKESQGKEFYMRSLLDASTDSILTFDHSYKIIHYNQVARAGYLAVGIVIEKTGIDLLQLIPASERELFKQLFDKALSGEPVEMTYQSQLDTHFVVNYIPIKNQHGEVTAVVQFSTDVTKLMKAQLETKIMLQESQAQAEELRAREEELRATMEAEARRTRDLERASSQAEAQKQMMLKIIEKLKEKEKESLTQANELRAQEEELRAQQEELRQNMEELEATLEAEARRSKETERNNAQLEAQKQMMIKALEKFKQRETELMAEVEQKEKVISNLTRTISEN